MKYSATRRAYTAFVVISSLALLACSDATSSSTSVKATGGAVMPDAQVDTFCTSVAAPYCEALFACCTKPRSLALAGGTLEACKQKHASECTTQMGAGLLLQISAGHTALDESRLATCIAGLEAMKPGGAACTRPPSLSHLLECVTAFQGTTPPGGACDTPKLLDSDFVPCRGGFCDRGKCTAFLPTGAACDPSERNQIVAPCNYTSGEACIGEGSVGKCAPFAAVGEACAFPDRDKEVSCRSMSCGPAGKCVSPTVDGICSSH